jgi:uncharacterized caspase-like protein
MKKALIVGIDHYEHVNSLNGCVNDAQIIAKLLERNEDQSKNFDVKKLCAADRASAVSKKTFKKHIDDLFKADEAALLYFAGHGYIEKTNGYLITSDCKEGDDGILLADILKIANKSQVNNKIIILDSCYSGNAGTDFHTDNAYLSEGMTILTASTSDEVSMEQNGHGVFTTLLIDALSGSAADILGRITPGSVYAHIDQSLSSWQQRPLFKTNIKQFISLRKVNPPVERHELHQITSLFIKKEQKFELDPSFEPESKNPKSENTKKFAILQKYVGVGLVIPKEASMPHMYHAAMESKYCILTRLGQHYWNLVKNNRI